jgi:hypothetical protein
MAQWTVSDNGEGAPWTFLLEEHQKAREQVGHLGLRRLNPGLRVLIWALRLYVLFMAVVVAVNVAQTLH